MQIYPSGKIVFVYKNLNSEAVSAIVKSGYQLRAGLRNGFSVVNGDNLDVYYYPAESVDLTTVTNDGKGVTAVVFAPYGDTCSQDDGCMAQRCVSCASGKDNVCINNVEFHRPDGVCNHTAKPKDEGDNTSVSHS